MIPCHHMFLFFLAFLLGSGLSLSVYLMELKFPETEYEVDGHHGASC